MGQMELQPGGPLGPLDGLKLLPHETAAHSGFPGVNCFAGGPDTLALAFRGGRL
jgi:hypothetical protein